MKFKKLILSKKPNYIKLAEDIDFYDLFKKIDHATDNCFLLESLGEESSLSRYSIIGFEPNYFIRGKNKLLIIDDEEYVVDNPYNLLRQIVPQDILSRNYAGGLVGYLSYTAVNYFEQNISLKQHPCFDQFCFGVFTDGIILDKVTGEVYYFYYAKNRVNDVQKFIKNIPQDNKVTVTNIKDSMEKKEYENIIQKVKSEIELGNTFQCEIGIKTEFEIIGDALVLYERLRKINPSPFMYYIKFGNQKIIGSSPELLFGMRNKEMSTFPLAGTIKRGKTPLEDQLLARQLLHDKKEIAEHTMLVDLHRNDLGRVARFGSVKVRSLMDIKRFSHVQHISSEITGLIRNNEDMFTALATNFPAGTLTGAPKIESIKIIEALENNPRGPYGGAVGHFGFNGDCTFAIPIRTFFIAGKYGFTQAASGIVYDSLVDDEYTEIQRKLAPMKEVLSQ